MQIAIVKLQGISSPEGIENLIEKLRRDYGEIDLTFITSQEYLTAAENLPYVNRVMVADDPEVHYLTQKFNWVICLDAEDTEASRIASNLSAVKFSGGYVSCA